MKPQVNKRLLTRQFSYSGSGHIMQHSPGPVPAQQLLHRRDIPGPVPELDCNGPAVLRIGQAYFFQQPIQLRDVAGILPFGVGLQPRRQLDQQASLLRSQLMGGEQLKPVDIHGKKA